MDPYRVTRCKLKMQRTIEQRYVKFCVGLDKSGTETLGMIRQAFFLENVRKKLFPILFIQTMYILCILLTLKLVLYES